MICPRCGKEIDDSETLCPFCLQEIDKNVEFNDFRKDGFVQIQAKDGVEKIEPISEAPKYFKIAELNIFVIAVVYILLISLFTIFAFRFIQKTTVSVVTPYIPKPTVVSTPDETEPVTSANEVKSYSIKDLYGSWCFESDKDKTDIPINYYTFDKSGIVLQNYGSVAVKGKFRDISDDEEHRVYLNIQSGFNGAYLFVYSGNKKDGFVLELIDEKANSVYRLVKAKAKSWNVKAPKKNKIDKTLVGKWLTEDKKKGYVFTSSGSFKRTTGNMTTRGAWSVNDKNKITVKYIKEALTERDIPYQKTKDKKIIIINNVEYRKS